MNNLTTADPNLMPTPSLQFHVITIFPEIFQSFLETSLVGKAREAGLVQVDCVDPRDHTTDKHRSVDDTPFGGGEGMVFKPEPVIDAMESVPGKPFRVLLTPQGRPLCQQDLHELAGRGHVMLICGRYEGYDERIRDHVDQEISLGDFVLCGGEVPAMTIIEGAARLVPGVLGNTESITDESHQTTLLEYPQYTRPREFRGREVPEVLLSGNHEKIRRWRRQKMLERTRARRPDLWRRHNPTDEDRELLGEQPSRDLCGRTYLALLHHPVLDRTGKVVTTAVTNLDLHDIARASRTYGLRRYFVVTPLSSQRELVHRITDHWRTGHGAKANPRRAAALRLLDVKDELSQVQAEIEQLEGERPLTVVTSAVARPGQISIPQVLHQVGARPLLLLLGTGWGLTDEGLAAADVALAPLRGAGRYNHLSVRSAASILLDRFFGMRH